MKIGLFTDSHYCKAEVLCKTRRPSLSLQKIAEAMNAFQKEAVDLCVCLGDLIDVGETVEESESCMREAVELIRSYHIPYRIIPGNHDYTVFSAEQFEQITQCPIPPYTVETDTLVLAFLDASYRSDYRRFDVAGVDWKDSNLPPQQLEYLNDLLERTEKTVVVLLHECADSKIDQDHRVNNADELRAILEAHDNVPLVLQGHYHKGADHTEKGIRYFTLPAMCEGERNYFTILDL